jgi:polar amino acid transport system substrate-binding protein
MAVVTMIEAAPDSQHPNRQGAASLLPKGSTVSRFSSRSLTIFVAAASIVALSACSSTDAETDAGSDTGLETLTSGKLTIATGEPAYFPWVIDDAPESGEGFEAAVAYAVAEELGYAEDDVVWTRTTFESAIAPGPKDFDLNLQQYSITDERAEAVDFSSPYYTSTQAVITVEGSAAEDVTTVDGLSDVTVGVASGTTSLTVFQDQTGTDPQIFNSNEDAVLALTSGQIDALVVDLPTAFYLTGVELDGGKILGTFDDSTGGEDFGIVLAKDSPLTDAVTDAVDTLRDNGTLDEITTEWLSTSVDVPVLK